MATPTNDERAAVLEGIWRSNSAWSDAEVDVFFAAIAALQALPHVAKELDDAKARMRKAMFALTEVVLPDAAPLTEVPETKCR